MKRGNIGKEEAKGLKVNCRKNVFSTARGKRNLQALQH